MQRYSAKMLSIFRAFIEIGIYDTEQYERSDFFYLELAPPIWSKNLSGNFKNAEDCCLCVCVFMWRFVCCLCRANFPSGSAIFF